ncbi:MAG TPA: methyltransferase [Thermomicrobiales bacterium]|nr:methyltransferase [Thermomicrobiales bacterium]
MTGCCCQGIEDQFNRRVATAELERYRRTGPRETTRLLLDALRACGIDGLTLLDIGGGVGAIQHELLRAGVVRAESVEASAAYLAATREEAARQGHADRHTARHGDFVALAAEIPPADIVTLDRVICCYRDMPTLVTASVARARQLYGLVYPRDTWWVRAGIAAENLLFRLRRTPFRTFAYAAAAVEAIVRDHGFERRAIHRTFVWQVVVYARP